MFMSCSGVVKKSLKLTAVVAMGGLLAIESMSPAAAFVGSTAALVDHTPSLNAGQGDVKPTDVRFRGRGFGGGRRGFGGRGFAGRGFGGNRGFRGRGYGYRGGYGGGIGIGVGALAAGALLGGAIAASQAAPTGDAVSYCESRFKSYDPSIGTYTGYDGAAHSCP